MPKWSPLDREADRRLVLGLNEGVEDALATLYDTYAERLYDYGLSLVQESKAAADIVHDALVDAGRRAPRMRDRLVLRAWLYGAVRRRCVRPLRGALPRRRTLALAADEEELSELLVRTLGRLAFNDQEVAVLLVRHDLNGADLAAVLGLPLHRAGLRARQVQTRAAKALADEVTERGLRCAGSEWEAAAAQREAGVIAGAAKATDPDQLLDPKVDDLAEHVENCPDCRRRREIGLEALLTAPPAPEIPAMLRHRVMHTGSDPELASYRADIAARGGSLTTEGMPRQPDVISPITRRWLFTGGAAAGAVTAALVGATLIGPGLPGSNFFFPIISRPGGTDDASGGKAGKAPSAGRPGIQVGPSKQGQGSAGQIPLPLPEGHHSPHPGTPSGQAPPPAGQLSVSPNLVQLTGLRRTAEVDLSASGGPVTWTATPTASQLQLSAQQGTIPRDGTYALMVSLQPTLVQPPGQAQILVADTSGHQQTISVSWTLALL